MSIIGTQEIALCDGCGSVEAADLGKHCPRGWVALDLSVAPAEGPAMERWKGHACCRGCLIRIVESYASRCLGPKEDPGFADPPRGGAEGT